MTGEAILIAALSGRALAASARRAGFVPLVIDAYGDVDTHALAAAVQVCPSGRGGLSRTGLFTAADAIAANWTVAGLVLGTGFEARPALIDRLASRYGPLLGCDGGRVRRSKDPTDFFAVLAELGIVHPETRPDRPDAPTGWLSKRVGGCGGGHVRRLVGAGRARPGRYYQREVPGTALSVMGLIGRTGPAFAFTTSWTAPAEGAPFRYGGSASVDVVDPDLEARLIDGVLAVSKALGLVGLVSFDFIVDASQEAFLLEVNPRPGATLDILDDAAGTLFSAHVAACRGQDAVGMVARSWSPKPRAAAYLYADRGPLTVPVVDWPDWVSDRPQPGLVLPAGAPVCTVHAEGRSAADAYALCGDRLARLAARLAPTTH
ncbi:MAG: ATP-grasp domain-containing protein [Hyphomicrobiaceae bacterium]|nr:ATP-grasp domain-containing protein [Hyphomicrobiaceae bacterium]